MSTITITKPAYTIDDHPDKEAVFEWVRTNWHNLSEHVLEEFISCLKAFAEWHCCKIDYCIGVEPDRAEFIRFSDPNVDFSNKHKDWESLPLTGVCYEHDLWKCETHDDLQNTIKIIHKEHDYIYSDEGLTEYLENNEHYFYEDGSYCNVSEVTS